MIKAVIFDLDGTLIDSMDLWHNIDVDFLTSKGIDPPEGISDLMKTLTIKESSEYFINTFSLDMTWEEVAAEIDSMARKAYFETLPLKDGVRELISQLDERGIPYGVATSTYPEMAEAALKRLKLYDKIKFLITQQEVPAGKTSPDFFLKAAEVLKLEPNNIAVVEDALYALKTAAGAGFLTVGVYDKSNADETTEIKERADLYFEHIPDMMQIFDERTGLERTGRGSFICTSASHSFGTDAVLLSDFASFKKNERILEVGTGCGAISVFAGEREPSLKINACDISEKAIAQAEISVRRSELKNIRLIRADVADLMADNINGFDAVISNPPYFESGTGRKRRDPLQADARHDESLTYEKLCACSKRLLRSGGRIYLCGRAERLCDVLQAMRENRLEPKRLRFVQKNSQTAPYLFLCEGKKDGNKGLTVERPLFMYEEGRYSAEMKGIYSSVI